MIPAIEHDVAHVGPAERARVVSELGAKHRRVAPSLRKHRYPAVRELVRTTVVLFRMLVARDFPLSAKTAALIVATLAYFISPFDVVPDTIAIVGYVDDALLVAQVALLLSGDIERWRARELARATDEDGLDPEGRGVTIHLQRAAQFAAFATSVCRFGFDQPFVT